jgi:hypothetical protein
MAPLLAYKLETQFPQFLKRILLTYALEIFSKEPFPSKNLTLEEEYTQGMTFGFAWLEMFFGQILLKLKLLLSVIRLDLREEGS